jgi:hypothetical protein
MTAHRGRRRGWTVASPPTAGDSPNRNVLPPVLGFRPESFHDHVVAPGGKRGDRLPGSSSPSYRDQSQSIVDSVERQRRGAAGFQTTRCRRHSAATADEPFLGRGRRDARGASQASSTRRSTVNDESSAVRGESEWQPRADAGRPSRDLSEVHPAWAACRDRAVMAVVGRVGIGAQRRPCLREERPDRRACGEAVSLRSGWRPGPLERTRRRAGDAGRPRVTVIPRARAASISSSGRRPDTCTTYGVAPASGRERGSDECTRLERDRAACGGRESMPSRP